MLGYDVTSSQRETFFANSNKSSYSIMYLPWLTSNYRIGMGFCANNTSSSSYGKKSNNGKTISWYNTSSETLQMNYISGSYNCIYYYCAIGK